ncbi:hypothetical protein RJ640_024367 [Escallonia rubra]|uniref:Uncharacterized protein n=1 Tax=Escallonia rubra TaxID=112253 RepID=A0AA88S0Y3_9ASTE|nr:hypothetical protein RJ640_024367 [Escallonia rubra]
MKPKNLAGSSEPMTKAAKEARVKDQEALSLIQLGVDDNVFEKIAHTTTAKKACDTLESAFKGIDKVKKCDVVNQLEINVEEMEDSRVVEKIFRYLDPKFDHVVASRSPMIQRL